MLERCSLVLLLLASVACPAQTASFPRPMSAGAGAASSAAERRAAEAFAAARSEGPLALHGFLERMPKGADLHLHLSGAVYAEAFVAEAIADRLCVDTTTFVLVAAKTQSAGPQPAGPQPPTPSVPECAGPGQVPAANALTDQALYDRMVNAFSMRSFVATPGFSAHDQFFATFSRLDALNERHQGEWLDEIVTRAARQNEQYVEIMHLPVVGDAFALAATLKMDLSDPANFAAARQQLLAHGMDGAIADARRNLDQMESRRNALEHCGTSQALPGCTVKVRWIIGVLRDFSPAQIFAQTLIGFELAARDPRVLGVNFLRAEDWRGSLAEYHVGMQMLDFLHPLYPRVHISLHAGELAPGLVPPGDLRFHIREAVELGHAERIGHGVDVMYETEPKLLLRELADRHIMIEINLTSNDVILGVDPAHHPLPFYRAAHVPVALSTDDEGVSRIDLTHEYVRAALEFHPGYVELKQMVRTALEHTFLPGASLWQRADDFTRTVPECGGQTPGADRPPPACAEFLHHSEHAAEQWELERRFRRFEAEIP